MVFIEGRRNGYDLQQCGKTMTVQELMDFLCEFDPNEKVFLLHDGGYSYGSITEDSFDREENDA